MALTSATATISSTGIGSGLDVNSIVTQLIALEKQPLTRLQTAATTLQTQLSAFGQIKSLVSVLKDAATQLFAADSYALTKSASSDAASVVAGTTTKAIPGLYSVAVASLASSQSAVSASGVFADSTGAVGTGSLTIRLGAWDAAQATFTPKAGSADITVPIGASENTLAGIRDKINAANAGVTATVVVDASGARLAFQSSATGSANGFRVTVADADGNDADALGLSRIRFDPPSGGTGMTRTTAAADAQATINGIAVTSAGNTLTDVIDGMTFSLSKVTTAPVSINITRDTDSIKSMLARFAKAYNDLNGFIAANTTYDAATKQGALLQGDSTTVGLQSQLRSLVGQASGASPKFGTLSALGLQLQKDGSLVVSDAALTTALGDLPEMTRALASIDATAPGKMGIGKRFSNWADGLLASNGSLPGKSKALQSRIDRNLKDQNTLTERLADVERRMRAQYAALDTTVAKANALAAYVKQQFYTLPKSESN